MLSALTITLVLAFCLSGLYALSATGGFTLDRGLKAREWNTGGQVITVRKGATPNLSNGTLTGGISNQNILTLRKNL